MAESLSIAAPFAKKGEVYLSVYFIETFYENYFSFRKIEANEEKLRAAYTYQIKANHFQFEPFKLFNEFGNP